MGRYFPVQLVVKKEAALSVNIDEQKKQKQKVYIFVYKIFSNNIFKSYTTITMWRCALAKWSHCKVASLFLIFNLLAINKIKTVFYLYWQYCPQSLHWPRKLGRYLGLKQYFKEQIQKTVIIVFLRNVLTNKYLKHS